MSDQTVNLKNSTGFLSKDALRKAVTSTTHFKKITDLAIINKFVSELWNELHENRIRKVVFDPDIRGGIPTLSGTRICVYEVADFVEGDGLQVTLETWPYLSREDVEVAVQWVKENPMNPMA